MSDYEPRLVSKNREQLRKEEKELSRFVLDGIYENLNIALEGVIYFKKRIVRHIVLMGVYLVAMIVFLFALVEYVPALDNLWVYIIFCCVSAPCGVRFTIVEFRNWDAYWDAWKEAKRQVSTLVDHYDAIGIENKRVLATQASIDGALESMPERFQ